MKFSSLTVFFIIFFTFFSVVSLSQTIGVSPGTVNLGEVEKGSTKLVNFYIITPSEETLLVRLEPERVSIDGNKNINNFSEEDITPWIKIISNPVELKASNEILRTTGGIIRGQREVSFYIEIPKNAEPGHHLINIKPIPLISTETIGPVGGRVVAIIPVRILLNVIGNVIRKGAILDVDVGNYVGNRLEINTYFQNTGTVTISVTGNQKIYDKDGNFIEGIYLGKRYVKPKEITIFKGFLSAKELSLEDYNVYTVIDYSTDKAEKSSIITLTAPPTALVAKREEGIFIPLLIIVILIIFILIIIYRRVQ